MAGIGPGGVGCGCWEGAAGGVGVRLEDLIPAALVSGMAGDGAVMVVSAQSIGSNALAYHDMPRSGFEEK